MLERVTVMQYHFQPPEGTLMVFLEFVVSQCLKATMLQFMTADFSNNGINTPV